MATHSAGPSWIAQSGLSLTWGRAEDGETSPSTGQQTCTADPVPEQKKESLRSRATSLGRGALRLPTRLARWLQAAMGTQTAALPAGRWQLGTSVGLVSCGRVEGRRAINSTKALHIMPLLYSQPLTASAAPKIL